TDLGAEGSSGPGGAPLAGDPHGGLGCERCLLALSKPAPAPDKGEWVDEAFVGLHLVLFDELESIRREAVSPAGAVVTSPAWIRPRRTFGYLYQEAGGQTHFMVGSVIEGRVEQR